MTRGRFNLQLYVRFNFCITELEHGLNARALAAAFQSIAAADSGNEQIHVVKMQWAARVLKN